MLLPVLWATWSQEFSLSHHWHNVCLLNSLSWGRRDDSPKVLNLVSMEDLVKLSNRMRRLSLLSQYLCVVKHCHEEGGPYRLIRFSAFKRSYLWPKERGFKRQTLCQWRESENCSDEVAQRTVNWILWSRDTCSHLKVEQCNLEKRWLCWEVGMWSTENHLHLGVWYTRQCR